MSAVLRFMKKRVRKAVERDRRAEGGVEKLSRILWPWRERNLVILVFVLTLLDYATTCAALEFSGNDYEEGGLLAGWVLRVGGFGWLFLVDIGVVIGMSLVAVAARFLYFKFGFPGFGRAAFVVLLIPYAVVAVAAVVNNIVLTVI
jgi:hypothetical protein